MNCNYLWIIACHSGNWTGLLMIWFSFGFLELFHINHVQGDVISPLMLFLQCSCETSLSQDQTSLCITETKASDWNTNKLIPCYFYPYGPITLHQMFLPDPRSCSWSPNASDLVLWRSQTHQSSVTNSVTPKTPQKAQNVQPAETPSNP